jgi:transcriptional antiterminator NusG
VHRNCGSDWLRWYALTVRHQHERQAAAALQSKNLETLLPVYRARRCWSDRIKELELPLFAGYIFCRFLYDERVQVLNTPGVAKIVGFGESPAPVGDQEIADLRVVMTSRLAICPWPYLKPGDRVRVERGPLRGLEGTLLREKTSKATGSLRLVIGVELLRRSVAVELEPDMVVPAGILCAAC